MLSHPLPSSIPDLMRWEWPHFEPLYADLRAVTLTADNVDDWLLAWTSVSVAASELYNRLYVAVTINTADKDMEQRFEDFTKFLYPKWLEAENMLNKHLLASGLEPQGFEIPLRNMRAAADLYRDENLPLLSEEQLLFNDYNRITGAQTLSWDGSEITVAQVKPLLLDDDRARREQVWRAGAERQLADRAALNDVWKKLLALRQKIAANAGRPDYRAYKWQEYYRFDYTPADTLSFHRAIEEVVVPVARRIYERRRQQLGIESVRPWDLDVDPLARPPLRPYETIEQLNRSTSTVFHNVHPDLGAYFDRMIAENLLDLDNRKNKAPGGYCTSLDMSAVPFIFANSVGLHEDVQTMLHEGGHAFHVFETVHLLYAQQRLVTAEFAEVASMAMELLSGRYLDAVPGGFYTTSEARRARVQHLESSILFWPYMAVVDGFQHWVYTNPGAAVDPAACDAAWAGLWQRFMPGEDWSGLDAEMVTGWQRKLHIFTAPFYYVEYGLAQLGAAQVWMRSLKDEAGAVSAYRRALSLGGTLPLPELYQAAGARLAFDAETLSQVVAAMEEMIYNLSE